jgi:metal-responsive CopG/Arc/MetJ family transcriptional regulator
MKNFMAPAKLLAKLQELSEREGVSESEIIRTAVEQYVTDALSVRDSQS